MEVEASGAGGGGGESEVTAGGSVGDGAGDGEKSYAELEPDGSRKASWSDRIFDLDRSCSQ